MTTVIAGWKPSLRNCTYEARPDWVPEEIYKSALAAKRTYNSMWEFWVYQVSQDYNCSVPQAEDACIRGLIKEINRIRLIYGDKIGNWWEDFMDMKSVYSKVQQPLWVPELGYKHGTPPVREESNG